MYQFAIRLLSLGGRRLSRNGIGRSRRSELGLLKLGTSHCMFKGLADFGAKESSIGIHTCDSRS